MIVVPSGADKEEKEKDERIHVPQELPILPLRGTVLYPELILPIMVGRKKSVKLIDDAMDKDRIIGVVTQKRSEIEDPKDDELHRVGVAALILRMIRELDGSQRVIVQGISRIRIHEFIQRNPYYKAKIEAVEEESIKGVEVDAMMMNLKSLFQKAVEHAPYLTSELGTMVSNIKSPAILTDLIASNLNINASEKQRLLEMVDVQERLNQVHQLLNREVQVLELGNKIQSQVKEDMDKTQREYYLREQLKAIKNSQGEDATRGFKVVRKGVRSAFENPSRVGRIYGCTNLPGLAR
jgi:ATP-dependent Lon protease